jgi:hypothetical protein
MNQHLDPERAAALMDGSLSRAERAAIEAHAADCAQCLQLLAAMARTEPTPSGSRWRLPAGLRWAVPIAAGATAVALWVNVDRNTEEPQQTSSPAAVSEAVPSTPAPEAPSKPQSDPAAPAASPRTAPSSSQSSAAKDPNADAKSPLQARTRVGQPVPSRDDERQPARQEAFVSKPKVSAPAAATAPSAAPQQSPAPLLEDRAQARAAPRAAAAERQVSANIAVISPDPLVRWRAAGGVIEGSTDGGKTWASQLIVLDTEILAGASVSAQVAWFVGRHGFVARVTDGKDWQQRPFPERVDLVAVRASSALDAQVTTMDARVFRTVDGGLSWTLQEIPAAPF